MTDRDTDSELRGPVWPWYALAAGLIVLLAVLDLLGAASPFAPG